MNAETKLGTYRFISDKPIITEEEDAFGHSHHVDTIEEVIINCETPCNIGLFGRWGVGKTSIINLLINRVKNKENLKKHFEIIKIDAWKLSKESLRQQILLELNYNFNVLSEEEIEDRLYNIKEEELPTPFSFWASLFNVVQLFLVFFISLIIILGILLYLKIPITFDRTINIIIIPLLLQLTEKLYAASISMRRSAKRIIPCIQSPYQFERLFKEILKKRKTSEKKLIVVIDNLDRCQDEVVVDMLSTIKTFMDLKGCIYLLACDDEALIKHLCSVMGKVYTERDAREFLRKFFHTSIIIPPFLNEKLDDYMDKLMRKTNVPLDPDVKDILIYATSKNPRRVKQFLNNMVVLYSLAKSREEKGLIAPGTITKNTDFLAKMVILRDEWPHFYRELSKDENLLDIAEISFIDERDQKVEILSIFYQDYPDLEIFLRRTRTITVPDVSIFVNLNQETFESILPELELLRLRVNEGDAPYFMEKLNGLSEKEKGDYFKEVIKILETNNKLGRYLPLFNNLHLISEVYHVVPASMKMDVLKEFEKSITLGEIIKDLEKFNVENILPIITLMRERYRNQIYIKYSKLLQKDEILNLTILDSLISHHNILPQEAINFINESWINFFERNESEAIKVLHDKFISTNVKQIINQNVITSILKKIDDSVSEINGERCSLFLNLIDIVSSYNKSQFISKMLTIAQKTGANAIDENIQFALRMLLEVEDVPQAVVTEFYDGVLKLITQMENTDHKIEIFNLAFKHLDIADNNRSSDLIENHVSPLLNSQNVDIIIRILNTANTSGLNLLTLEPIVNNILNRIKNNLPNLDLINRVINESPKEQESKIGNTLLQMIQGGNANFYNPALNAFMQNHDKFSTNIINEICRVSFEVGKGIEINQKQYFFEILAVAFKSCSETLRNEFVDQILLYALNDDINVRSVGVDYYGKVKEDISGEKRLYVARQIIQKLQNISEIIDSNVKLLFDVIIEDQEILEEGDIIDLLVVLTGQLNTAKSEEIQLIGLEYIGKVQMLYGRSNQVLNSVLNLARSSSNTVKESCKNVLRTFSDIEGHKGFWEDVEKEFGEKLIQEKVEG